MSNFYFPEDLLINVLSRLPARNLLCFRRVSKSWCNLIDNQKFAKMHLNRLINTDSGSKIIYGSDGYSRYSKFYMRDFSTNFVKEVFFSKSRKSHCKLLGSSNGVLCLRYKYTNIVLWNPLLQKYHNVILPEFSSSSSTQFKYTNYGFGYDKSADDYKIVALVDYFDLINPNYYSDGWIFSLKSNTWKKVQNLSYVVNPSERGILVSGSLHWITSDSTLLAFDLTDDNFKILSQPNYPNEIDFLKVGIFGDCLSLMGKRQTNPFRHELWVMKDYGIKDSWSRINIELPRGKWNYLRVVDRWYYLRHLRTVAYLKSNEQVIIDAQSYSFLYDLKKKSIQEVTNHNGFGLQAYAYFGTLERL